MFEDYNLGPKRHIPEPELVPIMDALVSVIFFLLLSTTFIELTKITLPPSKVDVISGSLDSLPLSAKFFMKIESKDKIRLSLKWAGEKPDMLWTEVKRKDPNILSEELKSRAAELASEFASRFPNEKNIQLAFSAESSFQEMVTTMDGIREYLDNIVLLSPEEVESNSP